MSRRSMDKANAIDVVNVKDFFGKVQIYDNLNLTVKRGTIYSLLGPSGCGKTTLLKSILGMRRVKYGQIRVFGVEPNTLGSLVPGPSVGYMPQEIALVGELNIKETLNYFGAILNLEKAYLEKRINFLINFVFQKNLPHMVCKLSGGEQRRLSMAVALLQEAPLLILDEPTVGVDPVLREKIWKHMLMLANEKHTSILLTTHYIEECMNANSVGLMRNGVMLAEDKPNNLMNTYGCPNLEDVFLKLCMQVDDGSTTNSRKRANIEFSKTGQIGYAENKVGKRLKEPNEKSKIVDHDVINIDKDQNEYNKWFGSTERKAGIRNLQQGPRKSKGWFRMPNCGHIKSAFMRNFYMLQRAGGGSLMLKVLLPALLQILICFTFGGKLTDVKVALYNGDHTHLNIHNNMSLSHEFLELIDRKLIKFMEYSTPEKAWKSVRDAKNYGCIIIPKQYTSNVQSRYILGNFTPEATRINSYINVTIDATEKFVGIILQESISRTMLVFVERVTKKLNYNLVPEQDFPVTFAKPLHGKIDLNLENYFTVPHIGNTIFLVAITMTTFCILPDLQNGIYNRMYVAGVHYADLFLSFVLTQCAMMFFQVIFSMLVLFVMFDRHNEGSTLLLFALTYCQGFFGLVCGLMVAVSVTDATSIIMCLVGITMAVFCLNTIVWPLHGMKAGIRFFSSKMPFTHAVDATRAISVRGWGISHEMVADAFYSELFWSLGFFFLALVIAKHVRKIVY